MANGSRAEKPAFNGRQRFTEAGQLVVSGARVPAVRQRCELRLTLTQGSRKLRPRSGESLLAPSLLAGVEFPARRWMVSYLRNKTVRCQLNGDRTYDRWVGTCFLDGTDIGAAAIAAGHALDCARYSGGKYRRLETPAAKSRLVRADYCLR